MPRIGTKPACADCQGPPTFAQRFTEVSILADLFLDKDNKTLDTFSEAGKSIFVAGLSPAGDPTRHAEPRRGEQDRRRGRIQERPVQDLCRRGRGRHPARALDQCGLSLVAAADLEHSGADDGRSQAMGDNPAVRSATEASDFDFSTFRKTPQSLYIAVSEDHIAGTLAPLLRLMFADLIASIRLNEPGPGTSPLAGHDDDRRIPADGGDALSRAGRSIRWQAMAAASRDDRAVPLAFA
jgi:type IV secretion system protein VirD4